MNVTISNVVFLDMAKAFDKVPHQRLLRKVEACGIGGNVLRWIRAWLTGRQQRVCLHGSSSGWRNVTSGVPQGSVLGPVLFLIYINDLGENIYNTLLMFADDTKMFGKVNDFVDALKFQMDLSKLVNWSYKWHMKFNTNKCSIMHVGRKNVRQSYYGIWVKNKCRQLMFKKTWVYEFLTL